MAETSDIMKQEGASIGGATTDRDIWGAHFILDPEHQKLLIDMLVTQLLGVERIGSGA